MALVFGDSFDHYLATDITKKWSSYSGTGALLYIETGSALSPHSYGYRMTVTVGSGYIEKVLATPITTFICGVWFRPPVVNVAAPIVAFHDSATPANEHVSVRVDTTGHITLTRSGTVLATSTNVLVAGTWTHLEVKATIGDATADAGTYGKYEVRVNGSATNWVPAATNADTRNGGNTTIGSVRVYSTINNNYAYSDYYLLDTTGSQASDFLGPCRFVVIRPVGAGNSAQFTGNYADNWQNTADPMADGDTTFNQSATAGHIDLFTMSDVPAGTVHAIQHVLYARQDAGAQRVLRPKTRIGGTNYNGVSVNLSPTYAMYTEPVVFSPATGGATAFTAAEVNGAEFGYEVVS